MQLDVLPITRKPSTAGTPATASGRPAAEIVAHVVPLRSGREVHLPPRFARAAVEAWFKTYQVVGDVVEGPCGAEQTGRPLDAQEWALRIASTKWDPKLQARDVRRHGEHLVYVFPKHTVALATAQAGWLLRALERAKPEEVDAEGRPLPWVPLRHQLEALGAGEGDDDDAVPLGGGDALPSAPAAQEADGDQPLPSAEILAWVERLSREAGFGPMPVTLTRGKVNKLGFTTGRVWYGPVRAPLRIHLTTCPNSDLAEVLATIVHELAHPLSGTREHGEPFKLAMLELACRSWGSPWFAEASQRIAERHAVLDSWLAAGIRSALRGGAPPMARSGDDGSMARVVTKVRKLRGLAADQLGRPEGITANAMANELVTLYGLGAYGVRLDAGIQRQMVDRWVPLKEGSVWRRVLAHAIAKAADVFALALPRTSRMHFFGRYSDVVEAEYLFSISEARIDRECERHLEVWKAGRVYLRAGDVVRERVSFCDSAVLAFDRKLEQILAEEGPPSAALGAGQKAVEAAEAFARVEHEKRGGGWKAGGRRTTRDNAAGLKVGEALELVRGLTSSAPAQKALPGR